MNLKYLQQFLDLVNYMDRAEKPSMKAFAQVNDRTLTQVSHMLKALEEDFDEKLLIRKRSSSNLRLTEKGELLKERGPLVLREVENLKRLIKSDKALDRGVFDLLTTHLIVDYWLAPRLGGFTSQYPEIVLNLYGTDLFPTEDDKRVNFTIGPEKQNLDSDIVQVQLGKVHVKLWAHENYLKRYGTPQNIRELQRHTIICYEKNWPKSEYPTVNWFIDNYGLDIPDSNIHIIRSNVGVMNAAKSGLGIFSLAEESVKSVSSEFVNILPDIKGPEIEMCLTYPRWWENHINVVPIIEFIKSAIGEKLG